MIIVSLNKVHRFNIYFIFIIHCISTIIRYTLTIIIFIHKLKMKKIEN